MQIFVLPSPLWEQKNCNFWWIQNVTEQQHFAPKEACNWQNSRISKMACYNEQVLKVRWETLKTKDKRSGPSDNNPFLGNTLRTSKKGKFTILANFTKNTKTSVILSFTFIDVNTLQNSLCNCIQLSSRHFEMATTMARNHALCLYMNYDESFLNLK